MLAIVRRPRAAIAALSCALATAGACSTPPEDELLSGLPCPCSAGFACVSGHCVRPGTEPTGGGGSGNGGRSNDASAAGAAQGGSTGGTTLLESGGRGGADARADAPDTSVGAGGAAGGSAGSGGIASGGVTGTGGLLGSGGIDSGAGGAVGSGGMLGTGGFEGGIATGGFDAGSGGVVGSGGLGSGGTSGSSSAGVQCGTSATCQPGIHCCFDPNSSNANCTGSGCPNGNTRIECDGPEDCSNGDSCCRTGGGFGGTIYACQGACGLSDTTMGCAGPQNCPSGQVCCETANTQLSRAISTACASTCSGTTKFILCNVDADCPQSLPSCQPSNLLSGFRRCF